MAVSLEAKMRELSPARRRRVLARAAEIRAEVSALRDVQRARKRAHARMARTLRITPDGVARLEERSNLLLFTFQKAVKAIGGKLSLIAEFRDRPSVVLLTFSEHEPAPRQRIGGKARSRP
ncbi:MAG: helix-turn-helix domain-containing protein [bacterium]